MILDIDNNVLEGSIPTEFGNLTKLVELDLDNNNLNGTIPTEFGLLIDLRELDMSKSESSKVEDFFLLLNW
jgi:Leucine-rich repeat (LRR) protein